MGCEYISNLLGICRTVRITRSATVASGRATPPAGLVISLSRVHVHARSAARLRVATSCVLRGVRSGDAAIERCETRSTHDNTPCTPWPLEPHRAPNRMVMDGAAACRPSTIRGVRSTGLVSPCLATGPHGHATLERSPPCMPRRTWDRAAHLACAMPAPSPSTNAGRASYGQSLRPIPFRRFERATSA